MIVMLTLHSDNFEQFMLYKAVSYLLFMTGVMHLPTQYLLQCIIDTSLNWFTVIVYILVWFYSCSVGLATILIYSRLFLDLFPYLSSIGTSNEF
jgi:hypothetical protein